MRKRIYISGPISIGNRNDHFHAACEAQRKLMILGYAPLNPMQSITLPFAWEANGLGHEEWLETDMPWVSVSHGLLRLPGKSKGADMEIEQAFRCEVPVFYDIESLDDYFGRENTMTVGASGEANRDVEMGDSCCKDAVGSPHASPIDQLLSTHDRLCVKGKEIMVQKNHDYTSGSKDPYANFRASSALGSSPAQGLLIRVMDKLQRLKSFDETGTLKVQNEGVEDACIDVINYMVLLRGIFEERERNAVQEEGSCRDIVSIHADA